MIYSNNEQNIAVTSLVHHSILSLYHASQSSQRGEENTTNKHDAPFSPGSPLSPVSPFGPFKPGLPLLATLPCTPRRPCGREASTNHTLDYIRVLIFVATWFIENLKCILLINMSRHHFRSLRIIIIDLRLISLQRLMCVNDRVSSVETT